MSISLANITVLITVVLSVTGAGIIIAGLLKTREAHYTSYDLYVIAEEKDTLVPYEEYIESAIDLLDSYSYTVYMNGDSDLIPYLFSKGINTISSYDNYMAYSDYVYLRNMIGLEPVTMNEDEDDEL